MATSVEPIMGAALAQVLPALARLRITVFRAYPYLYDGSLDYEQSYLSKFAAASDTIIVVARDGDEIVGAATASPMTGHADEFAAPFRVHGIDPETVYYFGESVLLPQYRGRGIGHAFFDHREARARSLGRFTRMAFCSVVRADDHPLRPHEYRPLDTFWSARGYSKVPGLLGDFSWKDIDQPGPSAKPMQFWLRAL